MIKVGEHITLDFIGVKKDYSQKFYEKIIYKIAKLAKVFSSKLIFFETWSIILGSLSSISFIKVGYDTT